ncbi:chemotaxis protein CheB [[Flexibacter] sp. ATCC 35208]|uniref:chemotaxis protein CheB n=1 Tax=[Flexibacter] sp. ATCC 35208 TaxID=1936242 RepID=UPI0009D1A7C9|nr:chemotaxis protein CheB [[Flexibacter] sp. ATCC 35208]OMP75279.1 chemotaxis protein CheR [[Flexibacter] sp. ATCC 35208]OMP75846.1 chemotaxis protein CheR [[Flexibacter] sp. ATCC 35208]
MIMIEPHHIIAIGASAGGMDEINTFFDNTPLDGVAYVIVQHLSEHFKSRMVDLLSRHSKLRIQEAENEILIQSNHVYLIPNDKLMTVRNGRLYLTGKEMQKAPYLTINIFFNSLAISYGKRAIAIVLSGLGSDGSDGVTAIKRAGGLVIVREPLTSKFSSMPSSAIATGMVDFVLEPSAMPAVIEDYVEQQLETAAGEQENENTIVSIIDYIKEQLPLDFSDYKLTTLLRRTKRRATSANFTTLEDYLEFLRVNPAEVETLAKDFLISVTSFFRDAEAFDIIEKSILPDLLSNLNPGDELKMWVAGCATGEEVYSMAILIKEQLVGPYKNTTVKLFATDLDSSALLYASKGLYHWSSVKDMSTDRLQKYFTKEGESYRVSPGIRQMVIFSQHDLVKNPPYCNMHFISCRNLLIYMTPYLQKKIFSMLLFGLKYNGYLFLGSSETPTSIINNLEVISKKWRLYKNISEKRTITFDAFSIPESIHSSKITPMREYDGRNKGNDVAEMVNDILANELDYLALIINDNYQVVKSYGNTAKYLLQQNFNSNLLELLPEQLKLAYNTLISQVSVTNKKIGVLGIPVELKGKKIAVSLTISPLEAKNGSPASFLIIFREDPAFSDIHTEYQVFDERAYNVQYLSNLESELKEVKEKLSAAYERIDAYNENMQSFNEELISSNEEMQSTNEEMQSVNEELHTINAEYQLKNKQLLEINDDLNNYFRSNINGQIFLNEQLELMKYSPAAVKLINLQEADIGRPISHISTNIRMSSIVDDVMQVLDDGVDIIKEIETNEGHWFQMMIMPYIKQEENIRKGAVISFNDITALKKAKIELDEKNESLLRINADLDHFIHMASHDLLDPLSSIESSIALMNLLENNNSELMEFTKVINSSVKKFSLLVRSIGTVARLENNMNDTEQVNISEVISNIEWSLEKKIKNTHAVITTELEVKEISFSQKNLRSILYNLISNAMKFSGPEQPKIHIQSRKEGKYVMLSVEDNGIGMTQEGIKKIFTIYGRLNLHVEGHGIGLYLARKIIHAAQGDLKVESAPGKGSKFIIYIRPS